MVGICAILHENGWAITNEAKLDADKTLEIIEGQRYSKDILTIKLFSIFDCKGELKENQSVECIFKCDNGQKNAFIGSIKSRGKQLTVVENLLKSERYNSILNSIKK